MSRPSRTASSPSSGGRVLHLDAFSGIAGNMFLAALLDLGLSRRALEDDLRGLGVGFRLEIETVRRGAIGAKWLDVALPATPRRAAKKPARKPSAARRRPIAAAHGAHHTTVHTPPGEPIPHAHGRPYLEIRRTLERARLDRDVRDRALAIFEVLADAEARVHRVRVERVHFHEVGAVDALIDVTGAAIGLQRLGIDHVSCSPVALGEGTVDGAHGRLPLPAPAALELLRGVPTVPAHVAWETVTPTGAAILRTIVGEYRSLPAMTIEAIGYGAGNDRPGPLPNVLRAILGCASGLGSDRVVVLETQLDDLVPEHFEDLMERLFEAGALDVSLQHAQMKKNRPGFLVRAIARPSERIAVARSLFAHSTTLGVRTSEQDRWVLPRETVRVATPYGRIAVKIVHDGEGRMDVSAEYDDCRAAARRSVVPLRDVVRAAEEAARREVGRRGR
ncbi:Pyridinium-3,5-bisthiocarboxylic acid mononucleotide nickel insertion protein [Myxococcaceae bacterium]|nr:Pyridinium-3,5-bisthiocarboxylic acid mononucleotide nickel insertion protein [Myxococcaceae bacterium]